MMRANPANRTLIRASAGTGKTFQLTNRIIALLLQGESIEKILATTFTKKAAGEILQRLFTRLARAASDDERARELSAAVGLPSFPKSEYQSVLSSLVANQHKIRIQTLDSFFIGVARAFSAELGLPFNWLIIDETEEQELKWKAVGLALAAADRAALLQLLQLQNKGGANRRIYERVAQQVSDLYELYVESNEAAWAFFHYPPGLEEQEVEQLIARFENAELPRTKAGKPDKNWEKAAARLRKDLRERRWEELLDRGLIKAVREGTGVYHKQEIPEVHAALCSRLLHEARHKVLKDLRGQTLSTLRLLQLFDEKYTALKLGSGALRFGDVKLLLARSAVTSGLEELFYRLDASISHLLFDEFQDTALAEWQAIKPIAEEILCQDSPERSFFCVGDVKQAIYAWRGGVAEIFDHLGSSYALAPQTMEASYRSASPIIEVVNKVFTNISANPLLSGSVPAAEAWGRQFARHVTKRTELAGYAALISCPAAEDNRRALCRAAAGLISELTKNSPALSVGVLVRRNSAIAPMIYELRRLGVQASEEGGSRVTDSEAVNLILCALKLADHPGDTVASYKLACSKLGERLEFTKYTDTGRASMLSRTLRERLLNEGYGAVVYWLAAQLAPHLEHRELTRAMQLVELAHAYQKRATLRPHDFISYVERTLVEDVNKSQVRVMTVHRSKGLEFDLTVLPELDYPICRKAFNVLVSREHPLAAPAKIVLCPKESIRTFDADLEAMHEAQRLAEVKESLNLLYVALTRAVHAMFMIVPEKTGSERLTYAGILRAALANGESGEAGVLFETGDRDWVKRIAKNAESAEGEVIAAPPVKFRKSLRSKSFVRETASGRETRDDVKLILRLPDADSLKRGTALHKLLEQITWIDDGAEALFPAGAESDQNLLRQAQSMVAQPAVRQMFSRRFFGTQEELELHRELPFAFREGDVVLTGTIDRLVLKKKGGRYTGAVVIDFKSDKIAADSGRTIPDKIEYYRPQMAVYKKVAARLAGIPETLVEALLVFLAAGEVCSVD